MVTKAAGALFDELRSESRCIRLVTHRTQIYLLHFRYHLRGGSRPFRMIRGESRHPTVDQRHVALTKNISYLIWGCPRPFLPRSFSPIGFSLDLAFISRAETEQSRLSSNSTTSLTFAFATTAREQTFRTVAGHEINPREGVQDGSIGWIDEKVPAGRSIAREREA